MQQEKKLETGDTVDKFYEDMMKVSQGRGDPKLTRLVAEREQRSAAGDQQHCIQPEQADRIGDRSSGK